MDTGRIEFSPDHRSDKAQCVPGDELGWRDKQDSKKRIVDKYARFMPIAQAVALLSKDKSTKVGSLILGPDYEIRSTGWNGAPRGCNADEDTRFQEREEKLWWVSHSEANAIAQAARVGTPLSGCTVVVTRPPCMDCAKLIVQAGILRVINLKGDQAFEDRWLHDMKRTRALFKECRIQHVEIDTIESKT